MADTEALGACEICGDVPDDGEASSYECPSCHRRGFDSCCMSAGSGCECLKCEEADETFDTDG